MMGKTHIAVGIAVAVAVMRPQTLGACFTAVLGGAFGGVICDIECRSKKRMRNALIARLIVCILSVGILLADYYLQTGIWAGIMAASRTPLAIGLAIMLLAGIKGRFSAHRTFSHSLMYVLLMSIGSMLVYRPLAYSVAAGCLSHLAIDLLNKKPIQWLYPCRNGVCFYLCYANKTANSVIMYMAIVADILLLGWRIYAIYA